MSADVPAGILLPPHWAAIPLADPRERVQAVRRLVAAQSAGTSATTSLTRELERAVGALAADAARAGGTLLAVSTMRVDDAPLPVSVTVFRVTTPRGMDGMRTALADLPGVAEAEGALGPVLRRARRERQSHLGGPEIEQIVVEYWLDPQDGLGLYHAVFASPLVAHEPQLVELFDAMIATVEL